MDGHKIQLTLRIECKLAENELNLARVQVNPNEERKGINETKPVHRYRIITKNKLRALNLI